MYQFCVEMQLTSYLCDGNISGEGGESRRWRRGGGVEEVEERRWRRLVSCSGRVYSVTTDTEAVTLEF